MNRIGKVRVRGPGTGKILKEHVRESAGGDSLNFKENHLEQKIAGEKEET
jgi:hypothetical protein